MNFIKRNKTVFRCITAVGISLSMTVFNVMGSSAEYLAAYEKNIPNPLVATDVNNIVSDAVRSRRNVNIEIDGRAYMGDSFLQDGTTYVSLRSISGEMGAENVSWDDSLKTATVDFKDFSLSAKNGENYITANGRHIWNNSKIQIRSGVMFVPLRGICQAMGYNVEWSDMTKTAYIEKAKDTISDGNSYYDPDSLYWLSRIINAEAEGESLEGKIAVGNVVLNRVNSPLFPSTIYGVIFDSQHGVQFTPTANGAIYKTPNEESILAAKLCLEGVNILPNALFFMNDKIATNTWVSDNREYIEVIGNHKFYA